MQPLSGIRVLDLTTLVPGPIATLALAEAGANVIKVERPGGDEARGYEPRAGSDSGIFAMLNRGKRSIVLDLKSPEGVDRLKRLVADADVLVEQFRPGVMARLGVSYDILSRINKRLIYCAISGYGQTGPLSVVAAHDLNYVAESGMLSLVTTADGTPPLPPALIADIAGGSYPAIINILMGLLQRERSGEGCYIDVSMAENVLPFLYAAIAQQQINGLGPRPGGEMTTGGSARYQIYRTADDRFLSVAPVEDRFWLNFCDRIGLLGKDRDDELDPAKTSAQIAARIREKTAAEWGSIFSGHDVCVAIVATIDEALKSEHFRVRHVFDKKVRAGEVDLIGLPMPFDSRFRSSTASAAYPLLNEAADAGGWDMFNS